MESPNAGSLGRWFLGGGEAKKSVVRSLRLFYADAEAFRKESLQLERDEKTP